MRVSPPPIKAAIRGMKMILPVNLDKQSYDIVIERGAIDTIGAYLNLQRKVLILKMN